MRYWELEQDRRAMLTSEQAHQLARQQAEESGNQASAEHILEDWWNRRARTEQRKKIMDSAMFFSRITNGDESLVRQCLEHTYSPSQLAEL